MQSVSIPEDSFVAQLLSITHKIYKSFACRPTTDVRRVFLDISKDFDKVLHEGLLFRMQSHRVEGSLFKLLKNYIKARDKELFNMYKRCGAGVPQGSVLGPL